MDLWPLSRVVYTYAFAIPNGTHPIYSHIASQLPCRSPLWVLVQFDLGRFVRFRFLRLLPPLDQTGSPIYYTLWRTLYLCNIPSHDLSLSLSLL